MHKSIKEILLPFAMVPRETLVNDVLSVAELDEFTRDHESFVKWDTNHDSETLAAPNLHDSARFIDAHRKGVRDEAKAAYIDKRK